MLCYQASVILKSLNSYVKWYGQHINSSKSSIFYSKNYKPTIKIAINDILKQPPIPARAKYLGIPLFLNKRKRDSFIELKERTKVTGWKAKLLSQVAKSTLIKSVANAIPSYLMSIFLIPKSLCLEINSFVRKFWWGFPWDKNHNLSFLSWEKICQP
jgi:hypothetical protein